MQSNPQIIRNLLSPEVMVDVKGSMSKWISAASAAPTERQRFSFARYDIFNGGTQTSLRESGVADMPPALKLMRQTTQEYFQRSSGWSGAVLTVCPPEFRPEGNWTPLGIEGFEKVAAVHVALSPYRIEFRFGRLIQSVFSLSAGDAVTIPQRRFWEFRADESRGERLSIDLLDLPGPFAND